MHVALVFAGETHNIEEFINMEHLRRVRFRVGLEPPHRCNLAQLQWDGNGPYRDITGDQAHFFYVQWHKWIREA